MGQRKLVAATLLKEVFERSPYGCKLFCCWCRQDLDANHFWEAMGFVPLAFRADAKGKYAHIFWQRRIREGDTTTPLWYPAKTDGGMMRQDRIVLPIPPGVHWKDPMPIFVPEVHNALPDKSTEHGLKTRATGKAPKTPMLMPPTRRRVQFGSVPTAPAPEPVVEKAKPEKPKREKVKADPAHVAKARELRDRYLEQFNQGMVLPSAKYDVCKPVVSSVEPLIEATPPAPLLLEQAA
jgi:hypothetical protein